MKNFKGWIVGLCVVAAVLYGSWWTVQSISFWWAKDAHLDEVSDFTDQAEKRLAKHGFNQAIKERILDEFDRGELSTRLSALERDRGMFSLPDDSYGKVNQKLAMAIRFYCRRQAAEKTGEDVNSRSPKINEAFMEECKAFDDFIRGARLVDELTLCYSGIVFHNSYGTPYSRERFREDQEEYKKLREEMEQILSRIGGS